VTERPRVIYIVILLWLTLSVIFVLLGIYSLIYLIDIPNWAVSANLKPILHFGYLMSTIVWFVFSSVFLFIAYGTFRKDHWVWSTGLILSTIFLAIFALMLTSFIINALRFFDEFSVSGLIIIIVSFITDLGLVFYLTRPNTKQYFEIN
jgi:hypothetical protein